MSDERVRRILEGVFSDGAATASSDGSEHAISPVGISPAEGDALRECVVAERAAETIEVGLGYGISTLFIVDGLLLGGGREVAHLAIDPHQRTRFAGVGLQLLEEAGIGDLVEHVSEESQVVLPRLVEVKRAFDLAFVDGNHRFEWFFVDLFYLGRLVRPGGVIFVDDYQLPAIAKAASFFLGNRGWTLESIGEADEAHRWAVLRTPAQPDERPFTHFADF